MGFNVAIARHLDLVTARMPRPAMVWVILAAGVMVRALFILTLQPYANRDRFEMERAAISLAETGVLGNSYAIPTGPTAHVAPLYAWLLAIIFSLFGTGIEGEIVKNCVSTLLSVVPYALMPRLAESLGVKRSIGFWAGLSGAIVPFKPGVDLSGDWEAPLASTLLVLCSVGLADVWRRRTISTSNALRQGIVWGLGLLTVPVFLPLFLTAIATGFLLMSGARASYLRFAALQVVTAGVLLAPWVIRNYAQLGHPVVTRTNPGLELRISNNDLADANEKINLRHGLYERYHPLQNKAEAEKVRELGEVEYNRRAFAEAKDWIRSRPGRFLELTMGRIKLFWFPEVDTPRSVLLGGLSVGALGGAFLLLRQNLASGLVLLLPLMVYPLPHYLVHSMIRHRSPIDWIGVFGSVLLLAAAAGVRWRGPGGSLMH
jgi:hypothetical protein